jgi:hypothetical protein
MKSISLTGRHLAHAKAEPLRVADRVQISRKDQVILGIADLTNMSE